MRQPAVRQPEPTTPGLYRDIQGDWWVRRSNGEWTLIYWTSILSEEVTNFIPPDRADLELERHGWEQMTSDYMPFTFIAPYPGV